MLASLSERTPPGALTLRRILLIPLGENLLQLGLAALFFLFWGSGVLRASVHPKLQ